MVDLQRIHAALTSEKAKVAVLDVEWDYEDEEQTVKNGLIVWFAKPPDPYDYECLNEKSTDRDLAGLTFRLREAVWGKDYYFRPFPRDASTWALWTNDWEPEPVGASSDLQAPMFLSLIASLEAGRG